MKRDWFDYFIRVLRSGGDITQAACSAVKCYPQEWCYIEPFLRSALWWWFFIGKNEKAS